MSDENPPRLSDLNVATVRRENEQVDQAMSDLEDSLDEARKDLAEKESAVEALEAEKEAVEELLAEFRDNRAEEYLERIKAANELVEDEDEVDVSELESADVGHLKTVAEMVERLAQSASDEPVSNKGSGPNLDNVDPSDVDGSEDFESAKQKAAEAVGMGSAYEKMKAGELGSPTSTNTDEPDALGALRDALDTAADPRGGL